MQETDELSDDGIASKRQAKRAEEHRIGKRLSIALVSDFFFPNIGGVEGHIYMLGQRLIERGHKVIVITHAYKPDRVGIRYLTSGLKVYYVPCQVIARQDTLPNFFSLLPMLRSIFVREKVGLVHAHQALSAIGLEAILHARTMKIKAVFTDHSLFGFNDAASILTNKLLVFFLSDVDNVICVSHTAKENTVLRAGLKDPSRVYVIPNAIVAEQFRPMRDTIIGKQSGQVESNINIVILSRLMYRKGIDLLIAAIPRICEMDNNVRFIIGGDGPKRVELEQMRERFALQHRVEMCGTIRQGEVQNHLNRGEIFLNASLTEAFGTGIVEAASCGLFVVSTKVGGIPEVLPPDMIHLTMPEEDDIVRVTMNAIKHIRSGKHDPVSYHQAVTKMYSWSDTAKRVEAVYYEAMERPMPSFAFRLEK
jgi:phosphatidylinositol glycan class A protein